MTNMPGSAHDRIFSQEPSYENALKERDNAGWIAVGLFAVTFILGLFYPAAFGSSAAGDKNGFDSFILVFGTFISPLVWLVAYGFIIYGIRNEISRTTGKPVSRVVCRLAAWWPVAAIPVTAVVWIIYGAIAS